MRWKEPVRVANLIYYFWKLWSIGRLHSSHEAHSRPPTSTGLFSALRLWNSLLRPDQLAYIPIPPCTLTDTHHHSLRSIDINDILRPPSRSDYITLLVPTFRHKVCGMSSSPDSEVCRKERAQTPPSLFQNGNLVFQGEFEVVLS